MDNNKAYLTAIKRNKISAPMKWLFDSGNLPVRDGVRVLDYGCGRGFDADFFGFDKYDPHYFPNEQLLNERWDCIVCNYVLNVVSEPVANHILVKIQSMLNGGSEAFITVRRDVKKEGFTSKGTFQRNPVLNLPVLHKTPNYCIYLLDKTSPVG